MDSYAKGENCVLFNYHFTQDASERYKAIELLIPSCNNQEAVVELLNLHERTTFPSSKSLGLKKLLMIHFYLLLPLFAHSDTLAIRETILRSTLSKI